MERLLLVEDDEALGQGIALSFGGLDYEVCRCRTLAQARRAAQAAPFNLVLLDLSLPDGNGLEFCRWLRAGHDPVPVIFLTANDAEYSEVAALEAGGDDYITKPFSLAVLRARVAAALRRCKTASAQIYQLDPFCFDFAAQRFTKDGAELALSATEQKLLLILVANRGRTVLREQLFEKVWAGDQFVDENTLSVAVRRLRGKLERDPRSPCYIKTVYGLGYSFSVTEDDSKQ